MPSSSSLFRKNVIFRDFNIRKIPLQQGLEKVNRLEANGENYATLIGTKQQINTYLQQGANSILSERLRTLNSLPKVRVIDTHKVTLQ